MNNKLDHDTIYRVDISTPIGSMQACATDQGICLLKFDANRGNERLKTLANRLEVKLIIPEENHHLTLLQQELDEYFHGKRRLFSVSLDFKGTEFQQTVWNMLQEIPYGTTRSYMQQANLMNNPKGIRAIASANGSNPIAIVVPCHRVIGSDGSLTGYAGGLHRKKWLLNHEREHSGMPVQQELKF